jgi:hypothetical protein
VIDGNFSADHLKMKRPENDVCLTPGGRYMVEPTRYEAHLHNAPDHREVGVLSYMILERLINFLRNLLVPTIRQ